MAGREAFLASVCDDAIAIFDRRLENQAHSELYKTAEFERIRTKMRKHGLVYSDEEIFELILKEYSSLLKRA